MSSVSCVGSLRQALRELFDALACFFHAFRQTDFLGIGGGALLAQQVVFRPQGAAERDDLSDFVFQYVEFIEHARTIVS